MFVEHRVTRFVLFMSTCGDYYTWIAFW